MKKKSSAQNNSGRDPYPVRTDYADIARRMVGRDSVTRDLLMKETGLSPGSVTKHARWLLDRDLIKMRRRPVAHAKRPIDELWLNPKAGTFLIAMIRRDFIMGELVGLDLKPIYRYEARLPGDSQADVIKGLSEVMDNANRAAAEFQRPIDLFGLCVAGLVDSRDGIIYTLHHLPDWEACQPLEFINPAHNRAEFKVWPQVACKARGQGNELDCKHGLIYIECESGHISLASVRRREFDFGVHGTAGHLLHVSIVKDGPLCYCGKPGCFHDYLHRNNITPKILLTGLEAVLSGIPEDDIAIEWNHPEPLPKKELDRAPRVHIVSEGDRLALAGLRCFGAQAAIERIVEKLLEKEHRSLRK
jgi:predicted NBD/HSP70 family sugar kinase